MKRASLFLFFGLCVVLLVGWRPKAQDKLNLIEVEAMLADIGYEVETPSPNMCQITLVTSGMEIPTRVTVSKNGEKIWLSTIVMEKEDAAVLNRQQLQAILQKNVTIGPSYFVLDGGRLRMTRHIDNREVDAGVLRKELDGLADHVSVTENIWARKG